MKLPRDLDAAALIKALARMGYAPVRQTGSHIRLACDHPTHSMTIPNHRPIKVGTLAAILADVAQAHALSREQVMARLFD